MDQFRAPGVEPKPATCCGCACTIVSLVLLVIYFVWLELDNPVLHSSTVFFPQWIGFEGDLSCDNAKGGCFLARTIDGTCLPISPWIALGTHFHTSSIDPQFMRILDESACAMSVGMSRTGMVLLSGRGKYIPYEDTSSPYAQMNCEGEFRLESISRKFLNITLDWLLKVSWHDDKQLVLQETALSQLSWDQGFQRFASPNLRPKDPDANVMWRDRPRVIVTGETVEETVRACFHSDLSNWFEKQFVERWSDQHGPLSAVEARLNGSAQGANYSIQVTQLIFGEVVYVAHTGRTLTHLQLMAQVGGNAGLLFFGMGIALQICLALDEKLRKRLTNNRSRVHPTTSDSASPPTGTRDAAAAHVGSKASEVAVAEELIEMSTHSACSYQPTRNCRQCKLRTLVRMHRPV